MTPTYTERSKPGCSDAAADGGDRERMGKDEKYIIYSQFGSSQKSNKLSESQNLCGTVGIELIDAEKFRLRWDGRDLAIKLGVTGQNYSFALCTPV
jgi:hypothetical protein